MSRLSLDQLLHSKPNNLLHIVMLSSKTVKKRLHIIHIITSTMCPSPPCPLWLLRWWCCCCWAPAPAVLAGLQPAGRGRRRGEPARAEPAAEAGPSLMSLLARHSEPAEMTYSAWCAENLQYWCCGEMQGKQITNHWSACKSQRPLFEHEKHHLLVWHQLLKKLKLVFYQH